MFGGLHMSAALSSNFDDVNGYYACGGSWIDLLAFMTRSFAIKNNNNEELATPTAS